MTFFEPSIIIFDFISALLIWFFSSWVIIQYFAASWNLRAFSHKFFLVKKQLVQEF